MHTQLYFSAMQFNWLHLIIGLYQLITGHKYWWVVHVSLKLGDRYLTSRFGDIAYNDAPPHGSRELYYYPIENEQRLFRYLYCNYWLNCATLSSCGTHHRLNTPAKLYQKALSYTYVHTTNNSTRQATRRPTKVTPTDTNHDTRD